MTFTVPKIDQEILDQAGIGPAELRVRGHVDAARLEVIHRPQGALPFLERIDAAAAALPELYARLSELPPPAEGSELDTKDGAKPDAAATIPIPLYELRENPRLLRAALDEVDSIRRKIRQLPRAVERGGEEPRAFLLAEGYLEAAKFVWNGSALRVYFEAAQQSDPLELKELWTLPTLLKFALVESVLAQANALLDARAGMQVSKAAAQAAKQGGFAVETSGLSLAAGTAGRSAAQTSPAELLSAKIKSLRELGHANWLSLMEPLVVFDAMLMQDPANGYQRMDFDSRERYRKRVADIAYYSEHSELQVAASVLELAKRAQERRLLDLSHPDPRLYLRQAHVGYYLIDRGFEELAGVVGYRPRFIDRLRANGRMHADYLYIGSVEVLSVLLIGAILLPLIPNYSILGGLAIAFFLLLLPATQGAVDLVNNAVTAIYKAFALPKLDFSKGIPEDYSTLVVVPTLLMNEKQVRELVQQLEVRFLANQDPHLHFAALTDLPDSVTRPRENDRDPLVDLAVQLIDELNERYPASPRHGSFFLLHRHRIYNSRQGVWMGWERKRGKLLDLNKYLKGEFDAFPVKAGNLDTLGKVQYIITLDSDTQLPRGTAAGMVGAMAHPLNRAIIDPEKRIVTEGYGILQPRVGVSVHSASRSRLASLYSGQTGFDIYTRAVSDTYQDLYGEGSFTGKGIYEVATLHAVLERRFPRNALLSHDLIEGAYARAGLVTDIEVIDDYPSHYSAFTRRQHRWVRGDWQIAQWVSSRVPDEAGRYGRNPISTISRWKILDNLRRSLVEPSTLILLVAGWLGLPGGALYWTLITLLLMFLPTIMQLGFGLGRAWFSEAPGGVGEAVDGFWLGCLITLLNLVFLPHQTMLALDAIVRSLVRRFITGERLLEWETAAEAEAATGKKTPVDRYLSATPAFSLAIAVVVAFLQPHALAVAAPILLLWGVANGITLWLDRPPRDEKAELSEGEDRFLREHALRVWRFFYEYGGKRHNYLIPDNVEEETLFEAARVSPTNFGLLLNARQAAVQLGFLTAVEFAELTHRSLETMQRLTRFRGHMYNWYDTRTLEPLRPITVSSVDSGNLAASLYTLRTGAEAVLRQPLLDARLFQGLETHWQLLRLQKSIPAEIGARALPASSADLHEWSAWILETDQLGVWEGIPDYSEPSQDEAAWWLKETRSRVAAVATLLRDYLPWLQPQYAPLRELPQLAPLQWDGLPSLEEAAEFAAELEQRLGRTWATRNAQGDDRTQQSTLVEQLRSELAGTREHLTELAESVGAVASEAHRLVKEMDFAFLEEEGRQLLSIGYEMETGKLHSACYDMLASEARIATFIAVARGELPQQGWFKMSRTHTMAFGFPVLLSWTGTMFEYLMPALWMRNYPDTLISRSLTAAVEIQREFTRKAGIPWGISESGYAQTDDAGHYHYQAFGIPPIALKWDAVAGASKTGAVISPYSTFLALGVDTPESMRNLHRMADAGWVGAYGFYEAADYADFTQPPVLVREWMAHHQGMAMMGMLNLLDKDAVQRWFHANPEFQASELLLHEKPIREASLKAEQKSMSSAQPALKKAS
jgi:cyclic beta-1,2-glucan synthetase